MVQLAITIRQASIDDAAMLAEVGERIFVDTFAAENTPENMKSYIASAFGTAIQEKELAEPSSVFLIAEVYGEVAGYARMKMGGPAPGGAPESSSEIVRLYVEKKYQGSGVGAALMHECISRAKIFGSERVWLGVWERNEKAKAFYRKWGFEEVGSHAFLLGTDRQTDIVMERVIGVD